VRRIELPGSKLLPGGSGRGATYAFQPRTAFWRIALVREVDVQIVGRRDLLSARVLHRVLALLGCEPLLSGSDLAQRH